MPRVNCEQHHAWEFPQGARYYFLTGLKMALVKASLTLFGGDTVVVRCSENCHIHLMSAKSRARDTQTDILSVQNRDRAYLTVPYSGTWNVLIDSHSQSLEHSISFVAA